MKKVSKVPKVPKVPKVLKVPKVTLKIDVRERDVIDKVKARVAADYADDIDVVVAPLEVGDMILEVEGEERWVVERKCIADLLSSIQDGRYDEQSYRLNAAVAIPNHNIVYLIEGTFAVRSANPPRVYSAMFSLNYFKGFSVWRSMSSEETAWMLCQCAKKLRIGMEDARVPYYRVAATLVLGGGGDEGVGGGGDEGVGGGEGGEVATETETGYAHVVAHAKRVKKDNITRENIGVIMLSQVPGVSAKVAERLLAEHGSLATLLEQFQDEAKTQALHELKVDIKAGKKQRIHKTALDNIRHFLLPPVAVDVAVDVDVDKK
jgi:ERCC4-type nuclease